MGFGRQAQRRGGSPRPGGLTGWGEHSGVAFRLFISHGAADRRRAAELAAALEDPGVSGLVAHDAITPGAEWISELRAALDGGDALAAVLVRGFHESAWTDQEVGYVLGQGKFAIALIVDQAPEGFLGASQGLRVAQRAASDVAPELVPVLCEDLRTAPRMQEALVHRLVNLTSWAMSNQVVELLGRRTSVTAEQLARLREAQAVNREVGEAFAVGPFLDARAAELGLATDIEGTAAS